MRQNAVENALEIALSAVREENSGNQVAINDVRLWLTDYLEMRMEDIGQFPEEDGLDHWDLTMADNDPSKDALFLVAVFSKERITLLGGRGPAAEVRRFAESDFPEDPTRLIPEVRRRFSITTEPAQLLREEFDTWLAQS